MKKKEQPTRKGNKRNDDAELLLLGIPPVKIRMRKTWKQTLTPKACCRVRRKESYDAQYARDLKLDDGGLELDLDALIAPTR